MVAKLDHRPLLIVTTELLSGSSDHFYAQEQAYRPPLQVRTRQADERVPRFSSIAHFSQQLGRFNTLAGAAASVSLCPSVDTSAMSVGRNSLTAELRERGEVQHEKEGHEVDGDQHQGKDGHQIACRLNLKCVPRRRSQETGPKRISEIEKTSTFHAATRPAVLCGARA